MQNLWRNGIVLAALILAIAFGLSRLSQDDRIQVLQAEQQAASENIVWSHGRDGPARNAEEHWEKHGAEFPEFHNARDYEQGALAFVTNPPPGTLTKSNDRGDTLYYQPSTNTFAVKDRRGEPRTFFRPDSGRAYWERQ
jgi:pyocin large subunit-like protein